MGRVDKHTNENEQNPNRTQGRWDHRRSGQFSIAEVDGASIRPCLCHDKSRQQADQPVQSRLSLGKRGGWGVVGNLLRGNQRKLLICLKRREKRNLAGALDGEPCTKEGRVNRRRTKYPSQKLTVRIQVLGGRLTPHYLFDIPEKISAAL